MRNFAIEGSSRSPEVWIDEQLGIVEIKGNSTLPNPNKFYKQVARWVCAFNHMEQTTSTVNFKISELDTRSSRWMMYLLRQIEQIYERKHKRLEINWICSPANNSMLEQGREFSVNLSVPFNIIAA